MKKILQFLKINEGELKPSFILFIHSFFLVAVIITSKTARDAYFLSRYDKNLLPLMYVITAIIMWKGIGYIQSRFKNTSLLKQNYYLHSIFAIGTLLFTILNEGIFVPILYLWVEIITALMGMKFWELATSIFNSRQGKRLFGIITTGGSISGVVTGMSISSIIMYGSESLILISSLAILFCILLIYQLKEFVKQAPLKNKKKEKESKPPTYSQLYPLAKHILWIVILTASLSTFIDYQFKIEIGQNLHSEQAMMNFFGQFYTITGIVSIIIQLFLSGRILSFFGISAGIGTYPILSLCGSLFFLFVSPFMVLIFIKGVDQVIKPTLLSTTMEIAWLPVSPKQKKIVKPFFNNTIKSLIQAITAVLIIGFSAFNLGNLPIYFLIIFCSIAFVMLIIKTKKLYMDAVFNAIESRQLDSNELSFDLSNPSIKETISNQLKSDDTFTQLFALDIIKKNNAHEWINELKELKSSPEDRIIQYLISEFGNIEDLYSTNELVRIAEDNQSIVPTIIKYLSNRENLKENQKAFFINHTNTMISIIAESRFNRLAKGESKYFELRDKIMSYDDKELLLKNIPSIYFQDDKFISHLYESSDEVKLIGLEKIDESTNSEFIEHILGIFSDSPLKIDFINSLAKLKGEILFPRIESFIKNNSRNSSKLLGVPSLLIKIDNQNTLEIFTQLFKTSDIVLLNEIATNISQSNKPFDNFLHRMDIITKSNEISASIFQNFAFLVQDSFIGKDEFIMDYFHHKGFTELECLLRVSCLLLDDAPIDSYIHSIKSHDSQVPFIIELLESELPSEISKWLIPIIEIESELEKYELGAKQLSLITELNQQCKTLYNSNDDWVQAIVSHLIALHEGKEIQHDTIEWEKLEPNLIADDIIEFKRIKDKPIAGVLKNYLKFEEDETMFTILERITTLKKIDLFQSIPSKVLYHVSQITEEVEFMKDEVIFEDREFGDFMMVIAKGSVKIHKGEKTIVELGDGACFGEMAILDGEPRSATATALEDCILFKITQRDFSQVLSNQNEVMTGIIKILTKRLRETTQKLYAN